MCLFEPPFFPRTIFGKNGGSKLLQNHTHKLTYGLNTSTPGQNVTIMAGGQSYTSSAPIEAVGGGTSGNLAPYNTSNFIIKI